MMTSMRNLRGFRLGGTLAALMGVMLIAGCASQPLVPQDRFYRLQAVMAAEPLATPKFSGALVVERFTADGLTAGRPIVYVEASDPNQLLEYHYHFWTQPPTIMLRDEMVAFLRQANIAEQVVSPEMRLDPTHILTARIRKLEQVLGSPNRTQLELEIGIRRPEDGAVVFLKSYRQEAIQISTGVGAAVDSLNEALNIMYSDFLADLKGL